MTAARTTTILLIGLALAVTACSQITVDSSVEPDWSPDGLVRYSWRPMPGGSLGDPRVDEEWTAKQIRSKVDEELAKKGYQKTEDANAQFQVGHWMALRMYNEGGPRPEETNWVSADRPPGYWEAATTIPAAHIEKGTIGVYVVDSSLQKNVWRGWARGVTNFKKPKSERKQRLLNAVERILENFPAATNANR